MRMLGPVLAAVLVAGCTSTADPVDPAAAPSTAAPTTAPPAPTGSDEATATPAATGLTEDTEFGSGTVEIDGTVVAVRGDCDVARAFGAEPVVDVTAPDVDIVLGVDNLTGPDKGPDGPFAFDVVLQDGVGGPMVSSTGAAAVPDAVWVGAVDVLELRDRTSLRHVDAAVLHVEAELTQDQDPRVPPRRELVVDVACTVTRPG